MDRKPVYSKDRSRRVISVTCGLWQLQEFQTGKDQPPASKTHDPWFSLGRPMEKGEALLALGL